MLIISALKITFNQQNKSRIIIVFVTNYIDKESNTFDIMSCTFETS